MDKGKGATLTNKVLTIDKYLVNGDDKQTKYFLTLFRFFLGEKMFVVVVTGLTSKFCLYMDRVPSFPYGRLDRVSIVSNYKYGNIGYTLVTGFTNPDNLTTYQILQK